VAWAQATLCANLGVTELERGRIASAIAHLDESLALCQQKGNRHSEAISLVNLGWAYVMLGEAVRRATGWSEAWISAARSTLGASSRTSG
jgi:hypothetical protein